jgi:small subunit ribosomal protein S11
MSEDDVLSDDISNIVLQPIKDRKKGKKHINNVTRGIVHIHSTFNNTKVYISDMAGNVVSWASAGKVNFKGSRKSTAYAAQLVGAEAAKRAMSYGMIEVEVRIKGPGAGRESAVRGISAAGLEITALNDTTPVPHNGCRPPKRRRV